MLNVRLIFILTLRVNKSMKRAGYNFISILIFFGCFVIWFNAAQAAQRQSLHEVKDKPLASEFVLKDIDGKEYRLSQFRGKVVIVNFWATWCPPCREEMPSMDRAYEKLKKSGILILAINIGEDEDAIFKFTADYPVNFPLLMDQDSRVINQWPVTALPTTYVVDPKGHIVYRAIGSREWDDEVLLKKLKALR
jgi:peroxiredoxin